MHMVKRTPNGARGPAHVPDSIAALVKIGEDIERRWAARSHRRSYFPYIAAESLSAASFHRQFDEEQIID